MIGTEKCKKVYLIFSFHSESREQLVHSTVGRRLSWRSWAAVVWALATRHRANSKFFFLLYFFSALLRATQACALTLSWAGLKWLGVYVAMVCRRRQKGTSSDDDDDDSLSLDICINRMAAREREENFQLCTSSPSGSILKFETLLEIKKMLITGCKAEP